MRKLKTALKLSPDDWVMLVQAWFKLLLFDLALRSLPFARVQAFAAKVKFGSTPTDSTRTMFRLKRFIGLASRYHLYPMTCLRQSLTLQYWLGCYGIQSDLRIGVRREKDKLDAHAWIECGNTMIGESPAHLSILQK